MLKRVDKDGKNPLASKTGDDLLLSICPGWLKKDRWTHFFFRYKEDLAGFFLSWLFVAVLILLAWGIMQIG